jgi:hypothetical protein
VMLFLTLPRSLTLSLARLLILSPPRGAPD